MTAAWRSRPIRRRSPDPVGKNAAAVFKQISDKNGLGFYPDWPVPGYYDVLNQKDTGLVPGHVDARSNSSIRSRRSTTTPRRASKRRSPRSGSRRGGAIRTDGGGEMAAAQASFARSASAATTSISCPA